jgi:hypothetical protein
MSMACPVRNKVFNRVLRPLVLFCNPPPVFCYYSVICLLVLKVSEDLLFGVLSLRINQLSGSDLKPPNLIGKLGRGCTIAEVKLLIDIAPGIN